MESQRLHVTRRPGTCDSTDIQETDEKTANSLISEISTLRLLV